MRRYRVSCVASSFHVDLTQECHEALVRTLPDVYDYKTITKASPAVRQIAEQVGGVRSDQLIYTAPSEGRLVAYALWWPWGDAETVSLRVGLCDVDPAREPYNRFRDVFGVSF